MALALVTDFNALGMFFHVLRATNAEGESVPLTMPRMSLKSDDTWRGGKGASKFPRGRKVRNTMTANGVIVAAAIKIPRGAAMNAGPPHDQGKLVEGALGSGNVT